MAPDCIGPEVEKMVNDLQPGQVLLLENVRFHKEEERNDDAFAAKVSCQSWQELPGTLTSSATGASAAAGQRSLTWEGGRPRPCF